MNKLISGVENRGMTENGAETFKSTLNPVLDFFSVVGALRERNGLEIIELFEKAYEANQDLAIRTLLYGRDIRGGLGERRFFNIIMGDLAFKNKSLFRKLLKVTPEFGYWKDIVNLFESDEDFICEVLKLQMINDLNSDENISLLGKWLPSENTSSPTTRLRAKKFRQYLGMTPKQYRKSLSQLRKKIDVIERKMSGNAWDEIDFSRVPSKAHMTYRDAFIKHNWSRYKEYLGLVASGEAEIKSGTLYPYEFVRAYLRDLSQLNETLELQWKNLPDYIGDDSSSFLPVVDVSGSMAGTPIEMAVGLGIYLSERNKGVFKDKAITFSYNPTWIKLDDEKTLLDKIGKTISAEWGMNTDLEKTFDLILETGVRYSVPQEDMPAKILIISDMEFDSASRRGKTNLEVITEKFKESGYKRPELYFWNVNAKRPNYPALDSETGVYLVSGATPSVMKSVLSGSGTAVDLMMETLMVDRYKI